jgi:acetyl-CoA carboxylase carboxyltransferase component
MSLEGAATLVRRKEIRAATSHEEVRSIQAEYADSVRALNSGIRAGRRYSFDDIILAEETRERISTLLRRSPRRPSAAKRHYIDPL